jgi:hypothetical protein
MIYGLTGKKRSGKTTAGDFIQQYTGSARINFKAPLLEEVTQNFPGLLQAISNAMDKTDYDGWEWSTERLLHEKPPLIRALLQDYGTNVRRADNRNYWVDRWVNRVTLIPVDIVTDDVRFINEADAIRAQGGVIIRIVRRGLENTDTHISETEMDLIEPDYTITVDDGDVQGLYKQLEKVLTYVR